MSTFVAAAILGLLVTHHPSAIEATSDGLAQGVPPYLINSQAEQNAAPQISTITEASTVIELDRATVFIDPVGAQNLYARFGSPDIVVLTRVDPSHLSIDTMIGMLRRDTVVLAPQVIIDQLPLMISNNTFAPFDAGTAQEVSGIRFTALPATANMPSDAQIYQRERGDIAVLMELEGFQVLF